MPITPGTRLGSHEIVAPLGAGGMGEVYRARDAKLGREVALKVLPELFARDPERLARFEREARLLAALNHPRIAAIYGLEPDGFRCLYAVPIDSARGVQAGPPFAVHHFHDPQRPLISTPFGGGIVKDAFIFDQLEIASSIWLLDPAPRAGSAPRD